MNRVPAWVKDVLVFAGFTALNLVLILPCGVVVMLSDSPKRGFGVSDLWYWVFATPAMLVRELGWKQFAEVLLWINPLLYGLIGWSVWRLFKLFRTKPVI